MRSCLTSTPVKQLVMQEPTKCTKIWRALHQQFIEECLADEKRFERSVKQASLKTFSENGDKNKKALDRNVVVLKCTRDLMEC